MSNSNQPLRVAVIGAGVAGAACAASLQRSGLRVTLFDKSRGLGGRMATRRVQWLDALGATQSAEFDHGAQYFSARHPRFRARMARAQAVGCVAAWQPQVHAAFPAPLVRDGFVAVPSMPALCRHLLTGVSVQLEQTVQRLQRSADGWQVVVAGGATSGPFDQVMLAMPPAQAAALLAGHHDAWADALAAVRMQACWTLMAVTDDTDWPWDAAEIAKGALAWVMRNDRKPGRSAPAGCATWVAHANPEWSNAHLEDDPQAVAEALGAALKALLPWNAPLQWHHRSVHRWRYAMPADTLADGRECWWDEGLRLGVCGDFLGGSGGGGGVEAAWRSGDELADSVAAWLEAEEASTQPA